MKTGTKAALAVMLSAVVLAGCSREAPAAQPSQPPADRFVGKTFALTPAVIAMRWQLLNPEINSFTFREMDRVFESRAVSRSGAVWDLPRQTGFAMPADAFEGGSYDYTQFAERT